MEHGPKLIPDIGHFVVTLACFLHLFFSHFTVRAITPHPAGLFVSSDYLRQRQCAANR